MPQLSQNIRLQLVTLVISVSILASAALCQPTATKERMVAVTFDDLPLQGTPLATESLRAMTKKLLASLKANGVPAFGDVNESKLYRNGKLDQQMVGILRQWLDAGMDLGNHTYFHADLENTPLAEYERQILLGEKVTKQLMREKGKEVRYFRHPVLHAGSTPRIKAELEKFLADHGYQIAPVTIDNQDFLFADVYAKAKKRNDGATMKRVADAYVPYMRTVFDFFERLSKDSLGYEVRQILLLHANELNADRFDELAAMMKERGYKFISLDEALKDPAYSLPDATSPKGLSWIHRWMLAKGKEIRPEPREPVFISELFRDYGH